nr:hypothetical protein Iba_chr01fCG7520 [Ipomoea batatas]
MAATWCLPAGIGLKIAAVHAGVRSPPLLCLAATDEGEGRRVVVAAGSRSSHYGKEKNAVTTPKTFTFCRHGQMISTSDLQAMDGACPSYLLQPAVYHCFQAIKGLAKDSKLLKSTKAAHFKEVKAVKADLTKLGASLATEQEGFTKATKELRLAREDALRRFKE